MTAQTKSAITREKLIVATREVLIEGGGNFEIADLERCAGVSRGLAYHHFGSKDGLIAAVLDNFYSNGLSMIRNAPELEGSWAEREERRFRLWLSVIYEDPFARIVLGSMGRTVHVAELEARWLEEHVELTRQFVEAGQQGGEISETLDPILAATAIVGALRQTATYALTAEKRPDLDYLASKLWNFLSRALGIQQTGKSAK